jgi:hypothetical protein
MSSFGLSHPREGRGRTKVAQLQVFGHNCEHRIAPGSPVPVRSYHPNQQNTSTGKLNEKMTPVNQSKQRKLVHGGGWGGKLRAKENIAQSNMSPTQSGERVSQGLRGVREVAKASKQERFTACSTT